jgi:hypothetical protein
MTQILRLIGGILFVLILQSAGPENYTDDFIWTVNEKTWFYIKKCVFVTYRLPINRKICQAS